MTRQDKINKLLAAGISEVEANEIVGPEASQGSKVIKVSDNRVLNDKGAPKSGIVCFYGYGRRPISIYAEHILDILSREQEIKDFLYANRDEGMSWKHAETKQAFVQGYEETKAKA